MNTRIKRESMTKIVETKLGKRVLDHRRDEKDHRDHKFTHSETEKTLPPSIDLRSKMPPVLNQGQLGSCGSNALSNCLHFDLWRELGRAKGFTPSRLYIYYNTRAVENEPLNQDTGITLRGGCKSLSKYSACDEAYWPYVIANFAVKPPLVAYKNALTHKKLTYSSVNQDETSLKACLNGGFPMAFGISVYSSFMSDAVAANGMVPMPNVNTETMEGGHAIICCGYDDSKQVFICQNSWGTDWGDGGFFYMPYAYLLDSSLADDFWKISYFD